MVNCYKGVNEASQPPEEQHYKDEKTITSQQLWEMLNEDKDLTPS
jgi:hypothetical protein